MHELAMGITSNNSHFGAVGNAYRADHFAGGSSGGTGAAVAANIATAGLGSDTGGSVRIPAAVNGVYGLRPTTGRYSQVGITPLSSTRDTAGPIGKSIADLALVDAVITGHEVEIAEIQAVDIRLGVPTNYYFDDVERSVDIVVRAALEKLAEEGVELIEVQLSGLAELHQATGGPITGYESGDRYWRSICNSVLTTISPLSNWRRRLRLRMSGPRSHGVHPSRTRYRTKHTATPWM